jgi:hypothetical protein
MKTRISFLFAFLMAQLLTAQGIDFQKFSNNWEAILAQAQAQNKPIFVRFTEGVAQF